ncbi:MAG: four helix bundle protein [Planctomycetes bacterium]|nr:four helix bundle protein [Planctomycetota bacterium]
MSADVDRPPSREAAPELLVLQRAEDFAGWLLQRTHRWPKSVRFTLSQRLENHALDLVETLVVARYDPRGRRARLDGANLVLERMRFLLRLAHDASACPPRMLETAARGLDELGRMMFGWRRHLDGKAGDA